MKTKHIAVIVAQRGRNGAFAAEIRETFR